MNGHLNCEVTSAAVQTFQILHHSFNDIMCVLSFECKNQTVNQEVIKSVYASGSTIMLMPMTVQL